MPPPLLRVCEPGAAVSGNCPICTVSAGAHDSRPSIRAMRSAYENLHKPATGPSDQARPRRATASANPFKIWEGSQPVPDLLSRPRRAAQTRRQNSRDKRHSAVNLRPGRAPPANIGLHRESCRATVYCTFEGWSRESPIAEIRCPVPEGLFERKKCGLDDGRFLAGRMDSSLIDRYLRNDGPKCGDP